MSQLDWAVIHAHCAHTHFLKRVPTTLWLCDVSNLWSLMSLLPMSCISKATGYIRSVCLQVATLSSQMCPNMHDVLTNGAFQIQNFSKVLLASKG